MHSYAANWGSSGVMLESLIRNPKVTGSSLGTGRDWRWEEWMYSALFHLQYHDWGETLEQSPAAAKTAAHCSGCVFTVCVFVQYSLLCVCTWKDEMQSRGLHWVWAPAGPAGPNANLAGVGRFYLCNSAGAGGCGFKKTVPRRALMQSTNSEYRIPYLATHHILSTFPNCEPADIILIKE